MSDKLKCYDCGNKFKLTDNNVRPIIRPVKMKNRKNALLIQIPCPLCDNISFGHYLCGDEFTNKRYHVASREIFAKPKLRDIC